MKLEDILKNRVSLHQSKMTGGEVAVQDLKKAFEGLTSVPVHGKYRPYHYVVFTGDKLSLVFDVLYDSLQEKFERSDFDRIFGGAGAFIFVFCKKIEASKIPFYEYEWSTACGAYSLQLNLYSLGYGTKWNTIRKDSKYLPLFLDLCCLSEDYSTMGYIMVGTGDLESKERFSIDDYVDFK